LRSLTSQEKSTLKKGLINMEAGIRHPLPLNCGNGSTDLMPVDATGKVRPDEGKVGIFPLTNPSGRPDYRRRRPRRAPLVKNRKSGQVLASYRI